MGFTSFFTQELSANNNITGSGDPSSPDYSNLIIILGGGIGGALALLLVVQLFHRYIFRCECRRDSVVASVTDTSPPTPSPSTEERRLRPV